MCFHKMLMIYASKYLFVIIITQKNLSQQKTPIFGVFLNYKITTSSELKQVLFLILKPISLLLLQDAKLL